MNFQTNLRKSPLDDTSATQAKLNIICVVEEDLDFEHLQSTDEQCDARVEECNNQSEIIERYNYLCYLRSMDDMV